MNKPAPIVLFVYNRLWHTQETVTSLKANELAVESDLIVYSDGAKNPKAAKEVEAVRNYIKSVTGFKSVTLIERKENNGLAKSIIAGVTETVNKYDRVIVLEDDMVLSKYFLHYMNDALNIYELEERVISIHGYCYPLTTKLPETFFLQGADCWGWATWKRGWDLFEPDSKKLLNELINKKLAYKFELNGTVANIKMLKNQINGKVDSWAIRWHASAVIKNKLTLYPGTSLVKNIGADGMGTHTKKTDDYLTEVSTAKINVGNIAIEENLFAFKIFSKYFTSIKPNVIKIMLKKVLKNFYYQYTNR